MYTSTVKYLGDLRTECTHVKSGTTIITDAPVDNNGKGSAFSPTDLLATSYASCMITIIGIYCQNHDIEFKSASANVTKIMSATPPRKVDKLVIELDLSGNNWDDKTREKVVAAGKACPVAKTLGDMVEVEFEFVY